MKNIAEVFQQLCPTHSPADNESLHDTFLGLTHSEQQRYLQFLEIGGAVERLATMLKNRAKKPTNNPEPSTDTTPNSEEESDAPSLASCLAISDKPQDAQHAISTDQAALKKATGQTTDRERRENLAFEAIQQAFQSLPGLPRRVNRKLPGEYRPAAPRNPSPEFHPPDWLRKAPPLIQKLVTMSLKELTEAVWAALLTLKKIKGMHIRFRKDFAKAITAVVAYLFSTMNLSTLQCATCVKKIAEACGLTSTQVSRILDLLAEAGFITKHLARGGEGHFLPLEIFVTPALIEAFGVSPERLAQVQQDHKKYSKPANQKVIKAAKKPATTDKGGSTLQQATDKFNEAIKPLMTKFIDLKHCYAVSVAELVDRTLRLFGFGRYSPNFSTA